METERPPENDDQPRSRHGSETACLDGNSSDDGSTSPNERSSTYGVMQTESKCSPGSSPSGDGSEKSVTSLKESSEILNGALEENIRSAYSSSDNDEFNEDGVCRKTPSRAHNRVLESDSDSAVDSVSGQNSDEDGISLKKLSDKYRGPASKKVKPPSARRPSRRAAQEALQHMHSETQRLVREAAVNLPYHQPKKMSLAEFLERKKSRMLQLCPQLSAASKSSGTLSETVRMRTDSGSAGHGAPKQKAGKQEQTEIVPDAATDSGLLGSERTNLAKPESDEEGLPDLDTPSQEHNPASAADGRLVQVAVPLSAPSLESKEVCSAVDVCYSEIEVVDRPVVDQPVVDRAVLDRPVAAPVLLPNAARHMDQAFVPKLRGQENDIIDFDSGKDDTVDVAPPPEELISRLARHMGLQNRKVTSKNTMVSIVRRDGEGDQQNLKLETFQWSSKEEDTNNLRELHPGAKLAALRESLQAKLKQRRMQARQKRQEAYNEDNEEGFEDDAEDAAAEEEEELTDGSDTDQEEQVEDDGSDHASLNASGSEEENIAEEEFPPHNPFIDGEAADSDRDEDDDNGSDSNSLCLHLDSDSSDASEDIATVYTTAKRRSHARILDNEDDAADDNDAPVAAVSDSDQPVSSTPACFHDAPVIGLANKASGTREMQYPCPPAGFDSVASSSADIAEELQASDSLRSEKMHHRFVLPVEDSQQLLGQQGYDHSQLDAPVPIQNLRMPYQEVTQASHSESLLLDDNGFLRIKSPGKGTTGNGSRRRLDLVHIPSGAQVASCGEEAMSAFSAAAEKMFATRRSPSPDGLMVAFATNDRQAATEEAIGLLSGGFASMNNQGISAGSPVRLCSGSFATNERGAAANEGAGFCSGRFTPETIHKTIPSAAIDSSFKVKDIVRTSSGAEDESSDIGERTCAEDSGDMIEEEPARLEQSSRKLKRVRLWAAEEREADEEDPAIAEASEGDNHAASSAMSKFQGFLRASKRKIRRDFVEEEAELSGSDDVSSDEEIAVEDAEEVLQQFAEADRENVGTEEELRDQVGRVHLKTLMDDDHKELLRMQERYLPDGDLYSTSKRVRRFRWGNADDAAFAGALDGDRESGEEAEEEADGSWRLQRYERERWLQQRDSNADEASAYENDGKGTHDVDDSQFGRLSRALTARATSSRTITSVNAVAVRTAGEESAASLKGQRHLNDVPPTRGEKTKDTPPTPSKIYRIKLKDARRGSFLARTKEDLAKIAQIAKAKSINPDGAKQNGNFVFAMVSPTASKEGADSGTSSKTMQEHSTPASSRRKSALRHPQHNQPVVTKLPGGGGKQKKTSIFSLIDSY